MATSVKGISTYQTYLMYRTNTSGSYQKLIDITSLSDYMRVYINGIGDTAEQTYGANYTPENYQAVTALEGAQYEYALWFGASGEQGSEVPDGHMGKFEWTGDISAGINGGGVNEAVGMTITVTPSTVIKPVFNT